MARRNKLPLRTAGKEGPVREDGREEHDLLPAGHEGADSRAKALLANLKDSSLLQFIKFCIVGVSNMVVNLAVYYLIVFINSRWYLAANVIGWLISVLNAFFWNNRLVFKGGGKDWRSIGKRLFRTYAAYAATMLLGTVLLHFEVQSWGVSEFIAPIINLFITTPINYVTNKFWAFSDRGDS